MTCIVVNIFYFMKSKKRKAYELKTKHKKFVFFYIVLKLNKQIL